MANYSDIKYQAAGSATAIYADMAALVAATGMSAGDQALVTALNKVFMYTGTAWYTVATMTNASPTAITGVDGSYALELDGTATTITAVSTDPEGFSLTWSYAVTTGSLGSTATVSQADNVFTITPSSTPADAGSFSITFSVTDGATGAVNAVSAFTLQFSVTNSRYTALSVKATATGSNQTFDDASTSNHTITAGGNVTASTFSPHRHGGYSAYFDGTGDYLQTTLSENIGTSQFTIECWVRMPTTGGPHGVFHLSTSALPGNLSGLAIFTRSSTYSYNWGFFNDGTQVNSSTAPSSGVWHHLALVRDSNNLITMYLNGNSLITATQTGSIAGDILTIGGYYSSSYVWNGDIRDFRIIKGTAVYASNFTPPTTPLTAITNTKFLLGRLPYFKDQSTSNHAITVVGNTSLKPKSLFDNSPYSEASHGASAYFDGSGDYLDLNGDAEFAFGTNDFTIEFWYYSNGSQTGNFCDFRPTSTQGTYTLLYVNSDNTIRYFHQSGDRITSSAISHNVWTHLALTRSGTDVKLFINGQQEGSTFTNSLSQLVGANRPRLGSSGYYSAGATHFNGYMSDIRILNGTAAYTSNFTPPTAPLTAITNTKFLLNPETSILDLSQSSAITCVADAATSTTQVKFAGTRSIAFDGTGDYLVPSSAAMNIPSSTEFTIEGWVYFTGIGSYEMLFGGTGVDPYIGLKSSSWEFEVILGAISSTHTFFPWHPNNNIWYYITVVRNSSNIIKLWIDGVEVTATSGSTNSNALPLVNIGRAGGYPQHDFQGYMQDVRVTKGLVRYTANFTPPTAEFEG